jgi:glycosyltransferase involved in cell wall biosynthesis
MRTENGTRKRIVALVNGGEEGALGTRARSLFEPLGDRYTLNYFYRGASKLGSLRRFLGAVSVLRPDLVYVLDTAVSGAGAAVLARRLLGTRFVVDTGDLGYELAELTGTPRWPGRKMIGLVESSALRLADAVIVRGTYHKQILEAAGRRDVHLIRDGIHAARSRPRDVSDLRRALGLEGCLCAGMMGSIRWNRRHAMCYGWDLVEAMGLLDPALPVRAVVVGDGDGLPYLQKRAKELGAAERMRFVGRVPYAQVPCYTGLMDVALSTQTNNRVGHVRTTGKLPEYMAAGCYVLATDVGEARLLLPPEMRLPYEGVKDSQYPARLARKITELSGWQRGRLRQAAEVTTARARAELDYGYLSARLGEVLARQMKAES